MINKLIKSLKAGLLAYFGPKPTINTEKAKALVQKALGKKEDPASGIKARTFPDDPEKPMHGHVFIRNGRPVRPETKNPKVRAYAADEADPRQGVLHLGQHVRAY